MQTKLKKIFITAGDPSGDIHAARLMREMKKLNPAIEFIGIGGIEMQKLGFKSLIPQNEISVVGFWEVIKKYGFFKNLLRKCGDIISRGDIDMFIPVDYPGFNIRLAATAKKANVPVYYYIAPQLWAWGRDRAKKLTNSVDKLFVVFPFEVDYFKNFNINTEYVGHPLLDDPAFFKPPLAYSDRVPRIALLPGSRMQEITKNLAIYEKITHSLLKIRSNLDVGIAISRNLDRKNFHDLFRRNPSWQIFADSKELMRNSLIGIVKTGTSNLEACLSGMPFAMVYKTSQLTYLLGKSLVNTEYLSLVNILSKKVVVNEYIQNNINPVVIAEYLSGLIKDRIQYENMQEEFLKIRTLLGEQGASRRAAEIIINDLT